MLRIIPIQAHPGRTVRLADYLWPGSEPDAAIHAVEGGEPRLLRSAVTGQRRVLRAWRLPPMGAPIALDETVFTWNDAEFAEVEQVRSRGGPNLHLRPIVLPALLGPEPVFPFGGPASVCLGFAGMAELNGVAVEAIRIDVVENGAHVQWMVLGVGEVAVGSPERFERWLVGWRGGERRLLAEVPDALLADLPDLPAHDAATPRQSLR
jgi:hypothetical protein